MRKVCNWFDLNRVHDTTQGIITVQKRILPTLKPGPVSVSADWPFSPMRVVLLPCSQVSWHWPFMHVRLQMSGAITTLKRSRVDARSTHRASRWSASQIRSRWERIREGMLASLNANKGQHRAFTPPPTVYPLKTRAVLTHSLGTAAENVSVEPRLETVSRNSLTFPRQRWLRKPKEKFFPNASLSRLM